MDKVQQERIEAQNRSLQEQIRLLEEKKRAAEEREKDKKLIEAALWEKVTAQDKCIGHLLTSIENGFCSFANVNLESAMEYLNANKYHIVTAEPYYGSSDTFKRLMSGKRNY